MKKLLFPILFCFSINVEASHFSGGTIYWNCLGNGKYQFLMEFYRDCNGIPWAFWGNDQLVRIYGKRLPNNFNGQTFNFITLEPDSMRYVDNRNGDNSPICNAASGEQLTCSNRNTPNARGILQIFYYKSDPITLKGIPPKDGWHFRWESACCRPTWIHNMDFRNVGGPLILRSTMYQTADKKNANPCFDSSPQWGILPVSAVCRGTRYTYNASAYDANSDSLEYNFNYALTTPLEDIPEIPFNKGFNVNSPTPGQSFDSRNVRASYDSKSGLLDLKVYSGTGYQEFTMVHEVSAYKGGTIVASIYREYPLSVLDCSVVPDRDTNQLPEILINGFNQNQLILDVNAGDFVKLPIEITDLDITTETPILQTITLRANGLQLANDLISENNCLDSNLKPCAFFRDSMPELDTTIEPFGYNLKGQSNLKTDFMWQTDCNHLKENGESKSYFFFISVQDDQCPIPAMADRVIQINVHPVAINKIDLECPLVFFDTISKLELNWDTVGVSSRIFEGWNIYRKTPSDSSFKVLKRISDYDQTSYIDRTPNSEDFIYFIEAQSRNCQRVVISMSDSLSSTENLDLRMDEFNNLLTSKEDSAKYQWYDCAADTIITDSIRQSFMPRDTGTYGVIVTRDGCSDTSRCIKVFPVGIKENLLQDKLSYYPNPTTGQLTIELDEIQNNLQVQLRNIHGQLIREEQFKNTQRLDLSIDGDAGIYFIQLINDKKEQANLKILKQ